MTSRTPGTPARVTPRRWHLPSLLVPSAVVHLVVLVLLWLLLWDQLSLANVLSGLAVAVVLLVAFPVARQQERWYAIRPLRALHFVGYVLWSAVASNVWLTRQVVGRRSRIRTGIVATRLDGCSEELLTFVAATIALTPGTMVVEATTDPPVLYVHVLDLRSVEEAREDTHRLEELAVRAFGSGEAIAALDERMADRRQRAEPAEEATP